MIVLAFPSSQLYGRQHLYTSSCLRRKLSTLARVIFVGPSAMVHCIGDELLLHWLPLGSVHPPSFSCVSLSNRQSMCTPSLRKYDPLGQHLPSLKILIPINFENKYYKHVLINTSINVPELGQAYVSCIVIKSCRHIPTQ